MTLNLLLAWWNLIYIVPFVLALMYLGLFVFTGITFGDADADGDFDADADVDADADIDADVDADADMDAGPDIDIDADADHDLSHAALAAHPVATIELDNPPHVDAHASPSPLFTFLAFLGLGKIPLSLALMIFLFIWGTAGFALNALLHNWLGMSDIIGLITAPITLIITCALTGAFAALIAKIIPNDDGKRQRRSDLVGKSGEAIYDIDSTFGMANVRGESGDLYQIPCRTPNGNARIPKGTRIVIFHYDREKGVYHVAPFKD